MTMSKLFITFLFFSFLGYIYEMIHMKITTKSLVNRGFLQGPIIPVYGVGMIIITRFLDEIKGDFFITLILLTLIIAITEYATSVIIEKIFKVRLWDYSKKRFNIDGRVCLNTMIQFIILALCVLYVINPLFMDFLDNTYEVLITILSVILFILFMMDVVFSSYMLNSFRKTVYTDKKDVTRDYKEYIKQRVIAIRNK